MGKKSRRKRQARSPGPHSSQILGAVVNDLDVGEGVLADKTAKRMFAGRSVSEYSRKERLVALAQALVDLRIVPDVDDRLRKGKFRDGLTTADIVADVIGVTCNVWDWLMEGVQSKSVEVTDFVGAGRRYLRLVTVDVALCMVVLAKLAQMELPEPHVPVWAQPNGSGEVLRGFQRELGLTRDQLAARLEVPSTTLDNWLDGKVVPGRDHLPTLVRELSRARRVGVDDLEQDLLRQFALARLAARVAAVVGWEDVGEDVRAAFQMAKLMQDSDGLSSEIDMVVDFANGIRQPGEPPASSELVEEMVSLLLLMVGPFTVFSGRMLRLLSGRPELKEWSDDLRAAALSPEMQLRYIAAGHSGGRAAAGLAEDYFDVVVEPSAEDLQARDAIRQVLGDQERGSLFDSMEGGLTGVVSTVDRSILVRRGLTRRFPENPDVHYQLGSMLGRVGARLGDAGLVDEGIMECKVAAGLAPRWDAPAVESAIILTCSADWDGALRELEWAESSLPAVTPHLRNVRGYVLMNLERFDEALAEFLSVVGTRPDFGSAWKYAAHCAFSLGNKTVGLQYAKKARALGAPAAYDAWDSGAYGARRNRRAR